MKQTGAILIQTLIFVLIIASLSSTMVELTKAELQVTRSYQEQIITFAQAQKALSTAELWVAHIIQRPTAQLQCLALPCVYTLSSMRDFHNENQWQRLARNVGNTEQPSYFIIELLADSTDQKTKITTEYYQITAISWSEQNHSRRIMQLVVSKQYNKDGNALNQQTQQQSWRLVR